MVSGCAKKEAPPVEITLKPYSSLEYAFSVDLPEPHLEKSTEEGRCYYFNCPDGSYKVFAKTMSIPNVADAADRENRDKKELERLAGRASAYLDAANPTENKKFTQNFKYKAYEENGSTNFFSGGNDGKHHLKVRFTDNDVVVEDGGAYRIQGIVGDNSNYVLAVEGKPEFVNAKTVQQFFDSFKVTGKSNVP